MVKIFPTSFNFIEQQKILSSISGEPLAIACSDECVFVAEEDCLLEVFNIKKCNPVGQFRTVGQVQHLVYNPKGDCIVTLEKKTRSSLGFSRVYFKWRGATVDRPARISMLRSLSNSALLPGDGDRVEIVELPGEQNSSMSCLACCEESGRIAVGMGSAVRIFTLSTPEDEFDGLGGRRPSSGAGYISSEELTMDMSSASDSGGGRNSNPRFKLSQSLPAKVHSRFTLSSRDATPSSGGRQTPSSRSQGDSGVSHSIELLLDIHTGMAIHSVAIFNNYVAFISKNEVRVVKIALLAENSLQSSSGTLLGGRNFEDPTPAVSPAPTPHPDSAHPTVHEDPVAPDKGFIKWSPLRVWEEEKVSSSLPASTSSSLVDITLPGIQCQPSSDSSGPTPIIGTLALPSITNVSSRKGSDRTALEVLGPVEHVPGQPISVRLEMGVVSSRQTTPTKSRVLTMLFRRFPLQGSESADQGAWLHTVQLLPIVVTNDIGQRQLVGISCFLANSFHGYQYDVHLRACLSCSFSFMSPTQAVVHDHAFLHALSDKSVETYTSRALQTAITRMPAGVEYDKISTHWLRKPCPPPSLDLTLVSDHKFVSNQCHLVSSAYHMVVLTKIYTTEHVQSSKTLSTKKSSDSSWNIYILQKKNVMAMHQQFAELADLMKDSSPPLYQHALYEAHNLLRTQLLLNTNISSDQRDKLVRDIRTNCLSLALSLCVFTSSRSGLAWAPRYLQLSHQPVGVVLNTITKQFTTKPSSAYTVLLNYLDVMLRDGKGSSNLPPLTQKEANLVLSLYAELRLRDVPTVVMETWLGPLLSPEKALEKVKDFLQQDSLSEQQFFLGNLCEVTLLLRLGMSSKASAKVKDISDSLLEEYLIDHTHFIINLDDSAFTPLGKLLRDVKEVCVLNCLYHLLGSGTLSLDLIVALLQQGEDSEDSASSGAGVNLVNNLVLKHFLEGVLLKQVKGQPVETLQTAQLYLVDVLVSRLTSKTTPLPSSTPFSLYGSRHKWLDNLPPFDGSSHKPAQVTLQDLMQLQALLASGQAITSPAHMVGVAQRVEECLEEGFPGVFTLRLLVYPLTGKMEQAMELVLSQCPALTVDYCHTYFSPDLTQWKTLLDLLLHNCLSAGLPNNLHQITSSQLSPPLTSHTSPTSRQLSPSVLTPPSPRPISPSNHLRQASPPPELHMYISLYKAALDHVVELCSPEDLLTLLPPSGALPFFLPFIERSCKLHMSKRLALPPQNHALPAT